MKLGHGGFLVGVGDYHVSPLFLAEAPSLLNLVNGFSCIGFTRCVTSKSRFRPEGFLTRRSMYGFHTECQCLGNVYGYKSENCSIFKLLKSRSALCMIFSLWKLKQYLHPSPQDRCCLLTLTLPGSPPYTQLSSDFLLWRVHNRGWCLCLIDALVLLSQPAYHRSETSVLLVFKERRPINDGMQNFFFFNSRKFNGNLLSNIVLMHGHGKAVASCFCF